MPKVCDWLYDANQWLTDHQSLGDSLESVDELLKASRDYEMGEVEVRNTELHHYLGNNIFFFFFSSIRSIIS